MGKKELKLTEALDMELSHIQTALTIALSMNTNGKVATTLQNAKASCDKAFGLVKEIDNYVENSYRRWDHV